MALVTSVYISSYKSTKVEVNKSKYNTKKSLKSFVFITIVRYVRLKYELLTHQNRFHRYDINIFTC